MLINVDLTKMHRPATAQRCRSETGKCILEDLFSTVLSQFKKHHSSGNLIFNNLGIFQSLKFRILMERILPISLKVNFTQNTLGCCWLCLNSVHFKPVVRLAIIPIKNAMRL